MPKVFVLKDRFRPTFSVGLAKEIGVNESLILLQIAYWIGKGGHRRRGLLWTYQSVTDLQASFPFMSRSTVNRAVKNLQDLNLVVVENHNKAKFDRTRWFAINGTACSKLKAMKSVALVQNESSLVQNEPGLVQNEPTIPHVSLNLKNNQLNASRNASLMTDKEIDKRFDELFLGLTVRLPKQQALFDKEKRKKIKHKLEYVEPVPPVSHKIMYRLCFLAESDTEINLITKGQQGKVASVLDSLVKARADLAKLHIFEAWWHGNWRSKDRTTKQYQAPRPDQVLEFWNEAMKSDSVKKPLKIEAPDLGPTSVNVEQVMRDRALSRKKQ